MKQDDVDTLLSLLVLVLFAIGVTLIATGHVGVGVFMTVFFGVFTYLAWFSGR